jgi:hypothetical protein
MIGATLARYDRAVILHEPLSTRSPPAKYNQTPEGYAREVAIRQHPAAEGRCVAGLDFYARDHVRLIKPPPWGQQAPHPRRRRSCLLMTCRRPRPTRHRPHLQRPCWRISPRNLFKLSIIFFYYPTPRITLTLHLRLVTLGFSHEQGRRLAIQRVGRVWVAEELGKEDLEDIDHVEHGRPGLVDDIEADRAGSVRHD